MGITEKYLTQKVSVRTQPQDQFWWQYAASVFFYRKMCAELCIVALVHCHVQKFEFENLILIKAQKMNLRNIDFRYTLR